MLKPNLIFLVLALLASSVFAQTAKRDLSGYDEGGTFDFNWSTGSDAHQRMSPQLRQFVWQHWHNKQRAHVLETFYSIEGDPTTYNLFIEPDTNGRWRVVAEWERECCWFYAMHKPKRKRERTNGVSVYDIVERIEPSKTKPYAWVIIAEDDPRQTYTMRLRESAPKSQDYLLF